MGKKEQASVLSQPLTWPVAVARISFVFLMIVLANLGVSWLIDCLELQFFPEHLNIFERAVLIGVVLYILLMATPFVPGIEIGLLLMILLGPKGVALIYMCTLIALMLSFGLGRIFPAHLIFSLLGWLRLSHAERFLKTFNETPPESRLDLLAVQTSTRTVSALLKRRYLILAALLNIPGNAVIGGAGGIAMIAGMTRIYSFPKFALVIALAILPGPFLILTSGLIQ